MKSFLYNCREFDSSTIRKGMTVKLIVEPYEYNGKKIYNFIPPVEIIGSSP